MELHQLKYFVATAETGSASRAASRCHIAQPSLSQQIRKLESSLGTRLFDRLGTGMSLTDAGRALLPRARAILGQVRDAQANLLRDVERSGSLVIGAIPTIAPYVLPAALRRTRQALPDCELTVREDLTENLIDALVDHEIDCALLGSPAGHDLVESEIIGQEELVVLMPKEPACKPASCPSDLRDQPRISLHEEHCLGRQIEGFCASRGLAPRIVCRTTQLQTIFALVGLGLGISIVPEMAITGDDKRFQVVKFARNKPTRKIVLAWRRHRSRSFAMDRFSEFVRERFKPQKRS